MVEKKFTGIYGVLENVADASDLSVPFRQFPAACLCISSLRAFFFWVHTESCFVSSKCWGLTNLFICPSQQPSTNDSQELTYKDSSSLSFQERSFWGACFTLFLRHVSCWLSSPPCLGCLPFPESLPTSSSQPLCFLYLTNKLVLKLLSLGVLHREPRIQIRSAIYLLSSSLLIPSCHQIHIFTPRASPGSLTLRQEDIPCGSSYLRSLWLLGVKWSTR